MRRLLNRRSRLAIIAVTLLETSACQSEEDIDAAASAEANGDESAAEERGEGLVEEQDYDLYGESPGDSEITAEDEMPFVPGLNGVAETDENAEDAVAPGN